PVGVLAQLLAELDPLLPGADLRADLVRLARQFRLGEQVAAVVEAGRTGVHRPEAEPAGRRGAELPLPWVEVLLDLRRAEVTQVVELVLGQEVERTVGVDARDVWDVAAA